MQKGTTLICENASRCRNSSNEAKWFICAKIINFNIFQLWADFYFLTTTHIPTITLYIKAKPVWQ